MDRVDGGDALSLKRGAVVDRFLKSDQLVGRRSPVWLATRLFGVEPWEKQVEILNSLRDHNFVAVRSCNGAGKTFAAALATMWWLMSYDQSVVITTAPTERQVRELLWREIRSLYWRNERVIGGEMFATRLELGLKRFAVGYTATTGESFQGFHSENILAIVDEASGVRESIFEAIFGCLTSWNAKLLMVGNPLKTTGTFYNAFHSRKEHWRTIHITAFDTPAFKGLDESSILEAPSEAASSRIAALMKLTDGRVGLTGITSPSWARYIAHTRGTDSAVYKVRVLGEFVEGYEPGV